MKRKVKEEKRREEKKGKGNRGLHLIISSECGNRNRTYMEEREGRQACVAERERERRMSASLCHV